ncbi:MAG: hypothetical protein ACNS62_02740 [Candidatus Cyclobacteriaceae bacterium M3_2C_046]
MDIRYTKSFLNKLEDIFAESDFILRYEKGNFKSGYCILKENKIAIINKFYSLEGKIHCLIEIIRSIQFDQQNFSEKNRKLLLEITQNELKF